MGDNINKHAYRTDRKISIEVFNSGISKTNIKKYTDFLSGIIDV